ncbi:MAG: VCBS repeat-containing protein, partial [Verrucomicrobiae bacterium]|nr:VCBS repeat-containing protein [Verrucomicrobiae bacterium]
MHTTVTAPTTSGSYRFTHWSCTEPTTTCRDAWGRSINPISVPLYEDTTATAHYLPTARDSDSDGIPDWYEMEYFGTPTNAAAADMDGDGKTLAQEYAAGTDDRFANTRQAGGVSFADSGLVTCNLAGCPTFTMRSVPPGTVNTNAIVLPGTSVTTPNMTQSTFGYWTLDGTRQADAWGVAVPRITFTLTSADREAVAYLFAGDVDGDGVPDAWEQYYYGTTNNGALSDTDGDGRTLLAEYTAGSCPLFGNFYQPGGVSWADSALLTADFRVFTNYSHYVIRSVPPGAVDLTALVPDGTPITTPNLTQSNFGYWALDGARQQDPWGVAIRQVSFLVDGTDRDAVAYLFDGDADGDGVPDAWEQYYYGTTNNGALSDTDADGRTLLAEYTAGSCPLFGNFYQPGGVSWADSALLTADFRVLTNYSHYVIRSVPPGTVDTSALVTNGTPITTPNLTQSDFGFWTLDGARQQDAWGVAIRQFSFTVNADRDAAAYLFTGDADGDGVPDAWEIYYGGTTNNGALSDTDGDGRTLLAEYTAGSCPLFGNLFQPGGISWMDSDLLRVNLQLNDRPEYLLVNGVQTHFFSRVPTNSTGVIFGPDTHPALGDWDGDGTVDLFVAAGDGVLRVFENTGSPSVPNLVERTTNFAAWAWAGITNPAIALGDWSGDGKADLVVGGDTGTILLLASTGDFAGQPATLSNTLAVASARTIPALADLSGDGWVDLLVLLDDGTVNLYTNTGNALAPFAPPAARAHLLGTAVPDATGLAVVTTTDSRSVLVSDTAGRIWEFLGDGALHFTLKSKVYGGSYGGFANGLTLASADFDGDGDPDLIGGFAEGGLVYMQNRLPLLLIDPPLATVVAGQDVDFDTLNASGATQWSLVRNSSGGSLVTNTGAYAAGAGQGMDVIEALDATGLRGRAYVNVIGASEIASFGKAIVVGGGKDLADPVWLATDYIAGRAYNVLRYKGYSRENIHYLSFDPGRDVDGDGLDNDIAGFSSHANVAGSFTNWTGNANRLLVYLVDHGSATPDGAYFRLNTGENLTSAQLDAWLDAIQDQHGTEVVVVLDFCYAGRFLQDLTYAGPAKRVVIAATSPGELTYFLSGGLVSFSDLFLSGLLQGLDLEQAFLFARQGMEGYQNGTLDDDGDGLYQAGVDGSVAATIPVGATHLAGKDVPVIGSVAPNQTLHVGTKATLWAEGVESYYPIDRVYCTIIPPSFSASTNAGVPVTAMSEVELTPQAGGRYTAEVDRFAEPGLYKINYYARDIWGSVSPPRQGLVTQA